MHYMGDDGTTSDDDRDMELPFRHAEQHAQQVTLIVPVPPIAYKQPLEVAENNYPLIVDPAIPSPATGCLFRPPRS